MPLCVCYSCGSKMDCDPSGICEICEANGVTSVMVCTVEDAKVLVTAIVEPPKPTEELVRLAGEYFDWSMKCAHVGCREIGVAMHQTLRYCGKHFNNLQRLSCIERGCSHKIPEME